VAEAAERCGVADRTVRAWTTAFYWAKWIAAAEREIKRKPSRRDEEIAEFLVDELHRRSGEERPAITKEYVEGLKAKALAQAGAIGVKFWDAPAEAVVCWLARKHIAQTGSTTPPQTIEAAGDWWCCVLLHALSTYENLKCYGTETEDRPPWCPPATRPHDLNPDHRLEIPE